MYEQKSYKELQQNLKDAYEAARQSGQVDYVPAGYDKDGTTLYKKVPARTAEVRSAEADMDDYWFSVGR